MEALRTTLKSRGWTEVIQPELMRGVEIAKMQAVLPDHQREGNFAKLSNERIGGMAMGISWALNVFHKSLAEWDQRQAEAAKPPVEEQNSGHPYAEVIE